MVTESYNSLGGTILNECEHVRFDIDQEWIKKRTEGITLHWKKNGQNEREIIQWRLLKVALRTFSIPLYSFVLLEFSLEYNK